MEFFLEFLLMAALSVLLAFLIGKLFSPDDADEIAGQGSDAAAMESGEGDGEVVIGRSDGVVGQKGRFERAREIEEPSGEKRFGADGVGSAGSGAVEMPVEVEGGKMHGVSSIEEEKGSEVVGRLDGEAIRFCSGEMEKEVESGRIILDDLLEEKGMEVENLVKEAEEWHQVDEARMEDSDKEEVEIKEEQGLRKDGVAEEDESGIGQIVLEEVRGEVELRKKLDEVGIQDPEKEKEETKQKHSMSSDGVSFDNVARSSEEEMELKERCEVVFEQIFVKQRHADQPLEEETDVNADHIGEEMKVEVKCNESLLDEEEDWEGIERTELEKLFGAANAYVGSGSGADALSKLSRDVQMQLYGLHKVATEGSCLEPQPSALKISARAKWHAWQRLGNMNPEMAMERYMDLLSEKIPGWEKEATVDIKQQDWKHIPVAGILGPPDPNLTLPNQMQSETESELDNPTCAAGSNAASGPNLIETGTGKIDCSPTYSRPQS